MSWLKSEQDLETHPKTLKLMKLMEWDLDTTIGKLHRFWWWCLKYAEDGDLRPYSVVEIGNSVGIEQAAQCAKFKKAMIKSEFIDDMPYLRVHNWWKHCGEWLRAKYKRTPEKWEPVRNGYVTVTEEIKHSLKINIKRM